MDRLASDAVAGSAVLTAGALGALQGPRHPQAGLWYALLRKPRGTPPGPAIAAIWLALEAALIVTGARLLRAPPSRDRTLSLCAWSTVLAGLAAQPWLFFGQRRLAASTAIAGGMLSAAVTLLAAGRRVDRAALPLTAPLVAWLGISTWLTGDIRRRNRFLSRD